MQEKIQSYCKDAYGYSIDVGDEVFSLFSNTKQKIYGVVTFVVKKGENYVITVQDRYGNTNENIEPSLLTTRKNYNKSISDINKFPYYLSIYDGKDYINIPLNGQNNTNMKLPETVDLVILKKHHKNSIGKNSVNICCLVNNSMINNLSEEYIPSYIYSQTNVCYIDCYKLFNTKEELELFIQNFMTQFNEFEISKPNFFTNIRLNRFKVRKIISTIDKGRING